MQRDRGERNPGNGVFFEWKMQNQSAADGIGRRGIRQRGLFPNGLRAGYLGFNLLASRFHRGGTTIEGLPLLLLIPCR
jgi:hypothetical protein